MRQGFVKAALKAFRAANKAKSKGTQDAADSGDEAEDGGNGTLEGIERVFSKLLKNGKVKAGSLLLVCVVCVFCLFARLRTSTC